MIVRVNDDVQPFSYHHIPTGMKLQFVPGHMLDLNVLGLTDDRVFWKEMGDNVTPLVEDTSATPGKLRQVRKPGRPKGS